MTKKALMIAATGQNVGKTTICLGIISGLKKRIEKVGFIKPVGQRHQKIDSGQHVDKDVVLFKKHFSLKSDYSDMSPVLLPAGFTKEYLDGHYKDEHLRDNIAAAFKVISEEHQFTVVEGTGHVGVGSIINLNNAQVAKELALEVIIISSGGIGKAFDELALNRLMCQAHGVKVKGVILNRVIESKKEMVSSYVSKALIRWNIPLIGCIPYSSSLNSPSIQDFQTLFNTELITGKEYQFRHFDYIRLVATSKEKFASKILSNELIITPASRADVIQIMVKKYHELKNQAKEFTSGMILTGSEEPSKETIELLKGTTLPALYTPLGSFDTMKKISTFTGKIQNEDTIKVEKAISLVEKNLNFELLLS